MAHAVADGAKSIEGVEVILKKAVDATLENLLTADGLGSRHAGKFRLHVRDGQGFL